MEYRNNELCHHGIKGMKWGIRRFQNKDGSLTKAGQKQSKAQRDANKLANVSKKYYDKSNDINAQIDSGVEGLEKEYKVLQKYHKETARLVTKLDKKYKNVSVIPEFDKNGYVVKNIKTSLTKLDRRGRIESLNNVYIPIETYDYRFGGSKQRDQHVKKRNNTMKKYDDKKSKAKTDEELEALELDLYDELDDLDNVY